MNVPHCFRNQTMAYERTSLTSDKNQRDQIRHPPLVERGGYVYLLVLLGMVNVLELT